MSAFTLGKPRGRSRAWRVLRRFALSFAHNLHVCTEEVGNPEVDLVGCIICICSMAHLQPLKNPLLWLCNYYVNSCMKHVQPDESPLEMIILIVVETGRKYDNVYQHKVRVLYMYMPYTRYTTVNATRTRVTMLMLNPFYLFIVLVQRPRKRYLSQPQPSRKRVQQYTRYQV